MRLPDEERRLRDAGNIPAETLAYLALKNRASLSSNAGRVIGAFFITVILGIAIALEIFHSITSHPSTKVEIHTEIVSQPRSSTGPPKAASGSIKEPDHSSFIEVRGQRISEGMSADAVFALLDKNDEIAAPVETDDPAHSGSLNVVHTYQVGIKRFAILFARTDDLGPYIVRSIAVYR